LYVMGVRLDILRFSPASGMSVPSPRILPPLHPDILRRQKTGDSDSLLNESGGSGMLGDLRARA